jgi:hypothetical protein
MRAGRAASPPTTASVTSTATASHQAGGTVSRWKAWKSNPTASWRSRADWHEICRAAPFDLLVLDGGGISDPEELLKPGGTIVIDDLTPASAWPPRFEGEVDQARMHWLTHPALAAAELRLAPDLAALVATRRFPGN